MFYEILNDMYILCIHFSLFYFFWKVIIDFDQLWIKGGHSDIFVIFMLLCCNYTYTLQQFTTGPQLLFKVTTYERHTIFHCSGFNLLIQTI